MKKGIAIIHKDGSREWFDPVIQEDTFDGILHITIGNGNTYAIYLPDTESIAYYDAYVKLSGMATE